MENPNIQICCKAPTTNLKSFLYFGDCFLWYLKVLGALEFFGSFISGPARTVEQSYHYWNDGLSRGVFLCFYSAIFKLTCDCASFFTYNSKTVCCSYVKFLQQFEINTLYICTKFRSSIFRDFGHRTRKPPQKFGVKIGLIQKRHKYGKNISHGYISSDTLSFLPIPFWPR